MVGRKHHVQSMKTVICIGLQYLCLGFMRGHELMAQRRLRPQGRRLYREVHPVQHQHVQWMKTAIVGWLHLTPLKLHPRFWGQTTCNLCDILFPAVKGLITEVKDIHIFVVQHTTHRRDTALVPRKYSVEYSIDIGLNTRWQAKYNSSIGGYEIFVLLNPGTSILRIVSTVLVPTL